eukprot:8853329-Alexandrium_andersonii.AAC.1
MPVATSPCQRRLSLVGRRGSPRSAWWRSTVGCSPPPRDEGRISNSPPQTAVGRSLLDRRLACHPA